MVVPHRATDVPIVAEAELICSPGQRGSIASVISTRKEKYIKRKPTICPRKKLSKHDKGWALAGDSKK